MSKPILYMMLGYPGAGKTFAAEVIARLTGFTHLSSDKVRLEMFPHPEFTQQEHDSLYEEVNRRTTNLLLNGQSVIYDANLNRYVHRKEKYDMCKKCGATPVLVWIQTPRPLARERATQLAHTDPERRPFGNLDEDNFKRLCMQIEQPADSEPTVTLEGTNITEEAVRKALGI